MDRLPYYDRHIRIFDNKRYPGNFSNFPDNFTRGKIKMAKFGTTKF